MSLNSFLKQKNARLVVFFVLSNTLTLGHDGNDEYSVDVKPFLGFGTVFFDRKT